jgi:hypothetical protein
LADTSNPEDRKRQGRVRRRRRRFKLTGEVLANVGGVVAGAATLIGVSIAFSSFIGVFGSSPHRPRVFTTTTSPVASLNERVDRLEATVQALTHRGHKRNPNVSAVAASVRGLDARLTALEGAIGESPVKALEVPLLRRDLENLKQSDAAATDGLRSDYDRQYDLMKWLLGTFVLGMIGTLATLFALSRRGKEG